MPRAQIDPRYFDTPYYMAPRDEVGQEAYAVIRDAMRHEGMVGMGRVVLAKRERPIVIEPLGDGLQGITLRYAHEVRSEAEYFADIPKLDLPKELLRLAEHIIATKKTDFDPTWLQDRYRTALVSMLREMKRAELPTKHAPAKPSPRNVINLLTRCVAASGPRLRRPNLTRGSPPRLSVLLAPSDPHRVALSKASASRLERTRFAAGGGSCLRSIAIGPAS